MLRRTLSSLVPVSSSESKIFSDQENETNFDPNSLPTPSPNRSKYEGKFVKTKQRRPLEEKTNKANKNVESNFYGKSNDENSETKMKKSSNEEDKNNEEVKEKKSAASSLNSNVNVSFQDLFHLNTNNTSDNSTSSKVEELSMALSETLKENEQLHDTVSLLKAEIDRLTTELLEYQEYAELYLLGKELIENQAEEIENLKKKLVKRDN